jgi:hypothetical protein
MAASWRRDVGQPRCRQGPVGLGRRLRPDTAVAPTPVAQQPKIPLDEIGIIGFDLQHREEVLAIAEPWAEVAVEDEQLLRQATLFGLPQGADNRG